MSEVWERAPIGYQINVTISPSVSGILVQLWWVLGGVPALIIDTKNTDSNGQVSFNPGASSYPVYMRVIVPAGQTIGGTEYDGDDSGDLACYEGSVFNVSLTLSPAAAWEHLEFYRGIEIEVYMPDGTPYRAYYNGRWDINYDINDIKAGIDAWLEPAVGIPTTLTLSVPDRTGVNENFNISGILNETDTGIPIPNQPINHSYNGRSLGSSTTGVDGGYLKVVSVPEAGVWTLKSDFPGTEGLQASRSQAGTVVSATPIANALLIAGPIVTGIALVAYGQKK